MFDVGSSYCRTLRCRQSVVVCRPPRMDSISLWLVSSHSRHWHFIGRDLHGDSSVLSLERKFVKYSAFFDSDDKCLTRWPLYQYWILIWWQQLSKFRWKDRQVSNWKFKKLWHFMFMMLSEILQLKSEKNSALYKTEDKCHFTSFNQPNTGYFCSLRTDLFWLRSKLVQNCVPVVHWWWILLQASHWAVNTAWRPSDWCLSVCLSACQEHTNHEWDVMTSTRCPWSLSAV